MLRAAPAISTVIKKIQIRQKEELFLAFFRAGASAVAYGCQPSDALAVSGAQAYNGLVRFVDFVGNAKPAVWGMACAAQVGSNIPSLSAYNSIAYACSAVDKDIILNYVNLDIELILSKAADFDITREPIWVDGKEPEWSLIGWRDILNYLNSDKMPLLRKVIKGDQSHWNNWTDWWEARRDGEYYDIEVERKIVLLPDEDWKEGPAHINSIIGDIRAKHSTKSYDQVAALQTAIQSDTATVSITEFNYDQTDQVMRMLPFADELARIETPACLGLLDELKDAAQDLSDDIHQSQAPITLKRTVKRYAEEAERDPVRPGRLHDLSRLLRKARANPDIMVALPDLADDALRQFVDKHLELMRSVLANTMARMERTESIVFTSEGSAEQVAEGLAMGVVAIRTGVWTSAPSASGEAAAIMQDISDEIRELALERDGTIDPEKRALRQAELDEKAKVGGGTMIRYSLRAAGVVAQTTNLAAAGKTLWPETFKTALDLVVSQFSGFKLPW